MAPGSSISTRHQIRTRTGFEEIFRTHYSPLCAYANGFLKDPDNSEEVVQEVMFRIWTKRESLVIDTSVSSYLYRAVRNSCMNVIKHMQVREEYKTRQENNTDDRGNKHDDPLIASELGEMIRRAIDRLPMERRKVFILSRYDGLTYQQIAEKLGISVKTVENQMGSALRSLREELKDYLPLVLLVFWN
jgi:RNA polymerase sigma-70 factor (ECF subfamily)